MRKMTIFALGAVLLIAVGCSSRGDKSSDPRQVVINMLRAVEQSDETALAYYLDFSSLLRPGEKDYALKTSDSPRVFTNPKDLLADLMKGGLTHERWMAMQRIVGDASLSGDTALVEVSFISQKTNTQYYNKWGLRKIDDMWKIFSFGVLEKEEDQEKEY